MGQMMTKDLVAMLQTVMSEYSTMNLEQRKVFLTLCENDEGTFADIFEFTEALIDDCNYLVQTEG